MVAPGVTKQTVVQPNRKAMDPATAVDISQVGEQGGGLGLARGKGLGGRALGLQGWHAMGWQQLRSCATCR